MRPSGQSPAPLQARFHQALEALDDLMADEQLEMANRLSVVMLKAGRCPFGDSARDRSAYDTLCDTIE